MWSLLCYVVIFKPFQRIIKTNEDNQEWSVPCIYAAMHAHASHVLSDGPFGTEIRTTFQKDYFPVGVHSAMVEALVDSRLGLAPFKGDFTGESLGQALLGVCSPPPTRMSKYVVALTQVRLRERSSASTSRARMSSEKKLSSLRFSATLTPFETRGPMHSCSNCCSSNAILKGTEISLAAIGGDRGGDLRSPILTVIKGPSGEVRGLACSHVDLDAEIMPCFQTL